MLALMMDMVVVAAGLSTVQAGECRSIVDPAARLACYDEREVPRSTPPVPAARAAVPDVRAASRPASPGPVSAAAPAAANPGLSSADIVRTASEGRVAAVTKRRYGLFRLSLEDGRAYDTTTSTQAPPAVGAAIRLRRTPLGTTFLDTPGRDPITVRLVRPDR